MTDQPPRPRVRVEPPASAPPASAPPSRSHETPHAPPPFVVGPPQAAAVPSRAAFATEELRTPAIHLGLGAVVALALHYLTLGIYDMGTHLFFHECGGHTIAAWFLGLPAIPAVWLTHTYEPSRVLALLVWAALVAGAVRVREDRGLLAVVGGAALLYPLLAFTRAQEVVVLAGGHGGEVVWAGFLFYRAVRGGWFQEGERPLYAALGWQLWVGNVVLFFRLATSANYRGLYESVSVADGVENDFVRVAAATHLRLATLGWLMLLFSLAVPIAGIVLGALVRRRDGELSKDD